MTGSFRTRSGGRIDRSRPLSFTFDGRRLEGFQGDTLASALIANGVHLVARSFKYHRPRGILSAGSEEPNALVTIDRGGGRTTPNVRATEVELYAGLNAVSQNRWPSLEIDLAAVADCVSPLLSAGFYYKTFLRPAAFWTKVYEPLIRRAAGLGRAPPLPDPDSYLNRYAHCDVLVCGAGPSGLAAALAASETGARVIVADEQSEMGGSLLAETVARIDAKPAALWLSETLDTLRGHERIRLLPRTTAFGIFPDHLVGLVERNTDHLSEPPSGKPRETLWQVRAKHIIVATGAIERPLLFGDNDRPGIMLADAARTYLTRYGAAAGARIAVATACDSAYDAVARMREAGIEVPIVADLRPSLTATGEAARSAGVEVMPNLRVRGTHGRHRVASVELAETGIGGFQRRIECDAVLVAGGWTPSLHLVSQAREPIAFDGDRQIFVPGSTGASLTAAGACNGTFGLAAGLQEGYAAGNRAAKVTMAAASGTSHHPSFAVESEASLAGGVPAVGRPGARARGGKVFVDFQNDVTVKDLGQALQEGLLSIEHVKRYTTNGMATDQGKTSNLNALAIVAETLGKAMPEVSMTTFRMPVTPVTFGALAGQARGAGFEPVRKTPLHESAVAQGAVFEDVGQWKRARYLPMTLPDGSRETMQAAVARECRITRNAVGMFDASTLGKIEIAGPDAGVFIARMYANHWPRLATGQCRYGLMLKDDGTILDDGIVAMLASDRFHVTTTTGGAARVLDHLEDYRQTEWPDLRVWTTSVTEQWAVIAVQGPQARETLRPLVEAIDLSSLAMPHMTVRLGRICGVPTRLFRVSFTGELGFEVNVPASQAVRVWDAIAGQVVANTGTVYGTETMHVLRAEKGYIIVGQETDGTVTADDIGLGSMVGMAKPDFVGKRGAIRADLVAPGRKQLVGLLTRDADVVLAEGAQVTTEREPLPPAHASGHVTSAYWSATLGRSIALALVENGRERIGTDVSVTNIAPGGRGGLPQIGFHLATLVEPVFYDREGARLRV